MFQLEILVITALIACCNSRNIFLEDTRPYFIIEDGTVIYEIEPSITERPQLFERNHYSRVRRQAHGISNPDGTHNVDMKIPLVDNDKNKLNAVGSFSGVGSPSPGGYKAAEGSLVWENVNGHGASLTGQSTPGEDKQVAADGKINLLHNDNHDVTASAFASRTISHNPHIKISDMFGGNLKYSNSKGLSASLSGQHSSDIGSQLTAAAKANLFHNENNDMTADAFIRRTFPKNPSIPTSDTYGGTLKYANSLNHEASLTAKHIPDYGNELTAAGKATLFHNNNHDLTANAFLTKTFSNNRQMPDFNKYGGTLGYTYDNKIGASLGMQYNDLFKKTDYSAMGNFNLFRDRSSSLDLNAGFSKSTSPFMPSSGWTLSGEASVCNVCSIHMK